jgi:cytochrome P450
MNLLQTLASAVSLYVLYTAFCLYQNYTRAKTSGFKLRVTPFQIGTLSFAILFGPFLGLVKHFLPDSLSRTFDLGVYGVEWRDRIDKRERETPGYMIVTPANELDLFVEDAEVVNAILARRRDFEQDSISRTCMNRFGPSLAGSIGESWSRQRRLIAPMLNERIMETVWSESQQQANKMMTYFIDVEGGTTSGTVTGLRKIAFNILSSIGYGMPTDWTADTKERAKDEKMDYMEALHHLIEGLLLLVVFPPRLLKQSWMPKALRQKGEAFYAFFDHSSILLQRERESLKSSGTPRNNFISSLAAVNDQEADSYEQEGQKNKPAFTKEEITGNLYQFTLAGYDTTANTMAYAVAMVVAYPEWQEWILEEVERVQKEVTDPKSYQEVLPKLERCLALMVSPHVHWN